MKRPSTSHVFSYTTLSRVLLALLAMTGVTVAASYVDLGRLNVWVALAIASVKAGLVLMVFMHMKYEGRLLKLSFLSTIGFLSLMIGFTFWDIAFR